MPAKRPSKETIAALQALRSEVAAGMVLRPRSSEDKAWNDSRAAVLKLIERYKFGEGLLQN